MSTSSVSTSLVHLREDSVSSILSELPCIRMCSDVHIKFFTRAVTDRKRLQKVVVYLFIVCIGLFPVKGGHGS